jgi:hypothetical protein
VEAWDSASCDVVDQHVADIVVHAGLQGGFGRQDALLAEAGAAGVKLFQSGLHLAGGGDIGIERDLDQLAPGVIDALAVFADGIEVGLDAMVMQPGHRIGGVVLHAEQDLAATVGQQIADPVGQLGGFQGLGVNLLHHLVGPAHAGQADAADDRQEQGHHDDGGGQAGAQADVAQVVEQAARAGVPQPAFPQVDTLGAALAHVPVKGFGGVDFIAAGLGADGQIARDAAVPLDRAGVGPHPVVVAVLAPVLHQARPGVAGGQGIPQVLEGLGRHVRVVGVAEGDQPLGVGGGNDLDAVAQHEFAAGDGEVLTHECLRYACWPRAGRLRRRSSRPGPFPGWS